MAAHILLIRQPPKPDAPFIQEATVDIITSGLSGLIPKNPNSQCVLAVSLKAEKGQVEPFRDSLINLFPSHPYYQIKKLEKGKVHFLFPPSETLIGQVNWALAGMNALLKERMEAFRNVFAESVEISFQKLPLQTPTEGLAPASPMPSPKPPASAQIEALSVSSLEIDELGP